MLNNARMSVIFFITQEIIDAIDIEGVLKNVPHVAGITAETAVYFFF